MKASSPGSLPAAPTDVSSSVWPDVSLIGVAIIWGVNLPLMKIGLEQVDLFVFNALRLVVSAVSLGAFAWHERRRDRLSGRTPRPGIQRRELWTYALIVAALYQLSFLLGVSRTTAGNAGLILATIPMWTALLARLFLGERLVRLAWGGLTVALIGTITVAMQKGDADVGEEHLLGNLLMLGAALLWAAGTVYSRTLLTRISPMQLSATAAALALPVHLIVAGFSNDGQPVNVASINVWLILLYSGMLSTGLALPMWNYGVRQAGSAHAAVIQNMVPLVAIIAAWAIRGEEVTLPQMLGGALILGGVVTMRFTRASHRAQRPEAAPK